MVESGLLIEYCGVTYVHSSVVTIVFVVGLLMPISDFLIVWFIWPFLEKLKRKKSQG